MRCRQVNLLQDENLHTCPPLLLYYLHCGKVYVMSIFQYVLFFVQLVLSNLTPIRPGLIFLITLLYPTRSIVHNLYR